MADIYLHLVFARRLRLAEGLHPLAAEALARRGSLVALGASLAALPGNERRGMSFLRRLFSRSGDAARWEKLLAATPGSPRSEVVAALLARETGELGGLARMALAFGQLSYELLEDKVGALTAELPPAERAAVERAQARLWLQATLPREQDLAHEIAPVLSLVEGDAAKRALIHLDRALASVHGSGPGEAALHRWVKSLGAELGALAEKGGSPPSLGISDEDARGPRFESQGFVEKLQAAVSAFVLLADRIAEAFTAKEPDAAAIAAALPDARAPEWTQAGIDELRDRWRAWLKAAREESLARGRNPKSAFLEGESASEPRPRGVTSVMSLADLPPETDGVGAPPLPELSGPNVPPSLPPTATQEVSLAQIEAEASEFSSPPHTQEVSTAQIEGEGLLAPPHTQEVSTAQIEGSITAPPEAAPPEAASPEAAQPEAAQPEAAQPEAAPPEAAPVRAVPPNVTQPVDVVDIVREQEAEKAAAEGPPLGPPDAPPAATPVGARPAGSAETAATTPTPHDNPHDNGAPVAAPPEAASIAAPAPPPDGEAPTSEPARTTEPRGE